MDNVEPITISVNQLYVLIRQMKEYRRSLENVDANLVERHDLEMRIRVLESILKYNGLSGLMDNFSKLSFRNRLLEKLKEVESQND